MGQQNTCSLIPLFVYLESVFITADAHREPEEDGGALTNGLSVKLSQSLKCHLQHCHGRPTLQRLLNVMIKQQPQLWPPI